MFWTVRYYPVCTHHIFVSHCAEDRENLIFPVFQSLVGRGISPWLDRHDYPYGRGSRSALRDSILDCRHTVFFITDAMLDSARGWCVQELAWAELLQDNMAIPGGSLMNIFLPLYFVAQADLRLPRSVWQAIRDKGNFCPANVSRIEWAVAQIEAFLRREQELAVKLNEAAVSDASFRKLLPNTPGQRDRVTQFLPQQLPLPPLTPLAGTAS